MTPLIRQAHPSDLPYFYRICLETADSGKNASALFSDPWLVGQFFAAPYVIRDAGLCFSADEDRIPKGYIVATDDTVAYNEWLETAWLPPLRNRYPLGLLETAGAARSVNERNLVSMINRKPTYPNPDDSPWFSLYPAHLHIDLLPDLQGKGCGRLLMERLFEALAARGCPGVHLGVDGRNENAIGFYGKLGFTRLEEPDWGFMLGKDLR